LSNGNFNAVNYNVPLSQVAFSSLGNGIRILKHVILILKQEPDFPIDNARKIVGLRNQIIHAYDNISDDNIWAIIHKHLPLLKHEVLL